jgi:hypothetical protein
VSRRRLRPLAGPLVVAPPAGARVRTRLVVSAADATVLGAAGRQLGVLAGRDLAWRCSQGRLDGRGKQQSRTGRNQALTATCTSRWAGAITRTSEDAWRLAERNLLAERRSLRARVGRLRRRLAVPVGGRQGRTRGDATREERWEKQRRLQVLQTRLGVVEARLGQGTMSVCRGGRRLARARHHLQAAGRDELGWRRRWEAARLFLTADGEADKRLGNETIRWTPMRRPWRSGSPNRWRIWPTPSMAGIGSARCAFPTGVRRSPPRLPPARSATTSPTTRAPTAGIWTLRG